MENQHNQIYESIPQLRNILEVGKKVIEGIRASGDIQAEVKGKYATGVEDDITQADKLVRDLYSGWMKGAFPGWKSVLEDQEDTYTQEFKEGGIVAFFDPLDATKAFKVGEYGSSTMVGVSIKESGILRPILGMVNLLDGPLIWGYDDGLQTHSNLPRLNKGERLEGLVLGRTPVKRDEDFEEISNYLTKKLPSRMELGRGMGNHADSLIKGRTDGFLYGNINLWDAFPVIPIIRAHGGTVTDYSGNEIEYAGSVKLKNGFVALGKDVPKERVISLISEAKKL